MNDTQNVPTPLTPEQEAMLDAAAARARAGLAAAANPDTVQSPTPESTLFQRVLRDMRQGAMEAPGQITRGALEAADAVSNLAWAGAAGAADLVGMGDRVRGVQRRSVADAAASTGFVGDRAQSVTGGFINEVSQFLTGFFGVGAVARAAGVVQATTTAGRVSQGMGQGGFADALAFNGNEERLANLIESVPALQNPVTAFLASSPEDTEAEGRFKAALEGLALGGMVEGLFAAVRSVRRARSGDVPGAVADADAAGGAAGRQPDPLIDEAAARQMDEEAAKEWEQMELPLEGGSAPRQDGPAAAMRENPDADPLASVQSNAPTYAPRIEVDEGGLREVVQQSIREAGFGQGRNISGIRTDLIEGNEDLNATLSALRVVYREQMDAMGETGRVRSLDEVRQTADQFADLIGGDPDLILRRLQGQFDNLAHADAEMLMYRDFLASIHDRTVRYAKALNNPLSTDFAGFANRAELGEQFKKHVELLANVQALYKGVQTNIARALNAMRLDARINGDLTRDLHNIEKLAARFAATEDNLKAATQLARGGFLRNATGVINEYWINALLSGPKTHVVNILSGLATSALQPAERMIGGALSGNREQFIEGALQYVGLASSLREAVQLAGRALRNGDSILDPGRLPVEQMRAITAERLGASGPAEAAIINGIGTTIRLPTRFLMGQDEFFKQLTYRARIRASAWREAMDSGHRFDSPEFAAVVARRMDEAFERGTDRATDTGALSGARSVTFTDDLNASTWIDGRTIGETLQDATTNHPFLTLILPFIRTPTNIVRFAVDRTPILNLARKQYLDDLVGKHGAEAAGMARAKFLTGGVMWGAAVTFALDGTITGGGPSDPTIRRQLEQTGWRPYSVRITNDDGTVSYRAFNRFDPFAMFFGLAADFAEIRSFMGDRDGEQLATDMVVAFARNLQSKTYLQGITNAIRALAEPDKRGERFIQSLAGSFVPSIVNATLRDDPYMREVRSVMDALRNRTPGSEGLDPVRNVLGEAVATPPGWGPDWISPIVETIRPGGAQPTTREWRNTPQGDVHSEIARQLVRHNSALRIQAPVIGSVDLREWRHPETGRTAYDRLQELTGAVEIGGMTLKERLADLIQSETYLNVATDGTFDHDGSRIDLIRRVVGRYRMMAERELRGEMPDLDEAITNDTYTRNLIRVQPTAPQR